MEWRDQGIVLSVRRHGESSCILEVLTAEHGRHFGVVRGGTSRRLTPHLQPGSELDLTWRARLEDHLGTFSVEPLRAHAGVMNDRLALSGLHALSALCSFALPEREAHPALYLRAKALLDAMEEGTTWPLSYLFFELAVLSDLGFGLDLARCAVTGGSEDLIYVSPKTGRAVSAAAAGEWADKLLPLPPCLRGGAIRSDAEILDGLRTTGYFLEHRLARVLHHEIPPARERLIAAFARELVGI